MSGMDTVYDWMWEHPVLFGGLTGSLAMLALMGAGVV